MPSELAYGLIGLVGLLLSVLWVGSYRFAPRKSGLFLSWVLLVTSTVLVLFAATPPLSQDPPVCIQAHNCVRHPHLHTGANVH